MAVGKEVAGKEVGKVVALRVAGMVAKEAEVTGPLPVDKEAGTAQEELG